MKRRRREEEEEDIKLIIKPPRREEQRAERERNIYGSWSSMMSLFLSFFSRCVCRNLGRYARAQQADCDGIYYSICRQADGKECLSVAVSTSPQLLNDE